MDKNPHQLHADRINFIENSLFNYLRSVNSTVYFLSFSSFNIFKYLLKSVLFKYFRSCLLLETSPNKPLLEW